MAEITIDNIVFNNVKNVGEIVGSAPISFGNSSSGPDTELGGIINAIDIDWNGAQIDDDVIINNTGELLNYIKGAYSSGGDSQSGGFTPEEITKLKKHVSDDQDETTIKNIDLRLYDLDNRITSLESQLTTLAKNASKVTFTPKSGGYLSEIKVEPAVGGSSVTGQVVGGLLTPLSNGTKQYGVVDISNDFAKKLDKTAISYDSSGNLTIDLN